MNNWTPEAIEAAHLAMFQEPYDGTTAPMIGSGLDAAAAAQGIKDEEITRLRAELADYKDAAASEAERVNELTAENGSLREDLTWFWAIVDKEGFADVPSSEIDALQILSQKASERDALREENARLREALNGWQKWWELPWEGKRPDFAELVYRRAADAIREGEKNEN